MGDILCNHTARTNSCIIADGHVFDYANTWPNIDIVANMCGLTLV